MYGIGAVIDVLTGLVIDYEMLPKYSPECVSAANDIGNKSAEFAVWQHRHMPNCQKNFDGSSNSMEMSAALIMYERSIEKKVTQ